MSKLNTFKIDYTGDEINHAIGAVLAGNVGSSGGGIEYTVNGEKADSTGNFIVNGDTTNAAAKEHTHTVLKDVTDLDTVSSLYADKNHTHDLVTGIKVNNTTLTNNVSISAGSNINISEANGKIKIDAVPYTHSSTSKVISSNNKEVKFFTGTQSEWDSLQKDSTSTYIAMII